MAEGGFEDRLLERLMRRRLNRLAAEREKATGPERYSERAPLVFAAQEELIGRYAPGRSFLDVACLWIMNGSCAFLAEELGATTVTASDKWPANAEYEAEHGRRGSAVAFKQADLHETREVEALGVHDVVWCSGLLYHTPSPHLLLANLLSITGEYLIVGSKVIPEVPGLPGAAVYFPGLGEEDRAGYAPISKTVAEQPFEPANFAVNWFWGLSPSALAGLASVIRPVELVEQVDLPWLHRHDSAYLVLRITDPE